MPVSLLLTVILHGIGLLMAAPSLLLATSFSLPSFPDQVKHAPLIIRGIIGNSYADFEKNNQLIYTYYEINITEVFKGSIHENSIWIREMGGEKDQMQMVVPGASSYSPQEDVIVFLKEKNSDHFYDVQDMSMSKFLIKINTDQNEYLVGGSLISNSDTQASIPLWTLKDLRNLIKNPDDLSSVSFTIQEAQKKDHGSLHTHSPDPLHSLAIQNHPSTSNPSVLSSAHPSVWTPFLMWKSWISGLIILLLMWRFKNKEIHK